MKTTTGQIIRELRKAMGLTQEDFPGLKQCHVSQIEADKVGHLRFDTLQKIAAGLKMRTAMLVDIIEGRG